MLTPRQQAFTEEYLVDLNGAQAAKRAGYSPLAAGEHAYVLLRNPEVAEAIEQGMAQRAARVGIEQDTVIYELSHIAFSRALHYTLDPSTGKLVLSEDAPIGAMAAVAGVVYRKYVHVEDDGSTTTTYETEVRLHDKLKALLLLGKHLGMFPTRVEISTPDLKHLTDDEIAARAAALGAALRGTQDDDEGAALRGTQDDVQCPRSDERS